MSLLTLENISLEYGTRILLDGAGLRVERGERVALVGANGSGKTTLIRIALGLQHADSGTVVIARNARVGYVSQGLGLEHGDAMEETGRAFEHVARLERRLRDLETQMAELSASHDSSDYDRLMKEYGRLTTEFERLDGYTVESRIKATLLGLGLREEALTLPVDRLSGGERMRVALARVLLGEPDLLILDEPTNHLDIPATEWFEGFLRSFAGGVLVVSHDRYFLDQVATRVAELANGRITERSGNYSTYLEQKDRRIRHVYDERKRLTHEIRRNEEVAAKLKSMRNISGWKSRLKAADRLRDELVEVGREAPKSSPHMQVHINQARHVSAEMAQAKKLCKRFGDVRIFDGVDFLIRGGEHVGLIGPNGCGKTTLINILLGKDTDFTGFARLGSWVKYGYLGQETTFEDEERTVMEELQATREMSEPEALNHLAKFLFFGDDVHKRISVLSGGEKVRLLLACILLNEPHCLILDEPTNHLDVPAREALEDALVNFKGTILAVSHDRYFLNRCVSRIMEIENARINSYPGNYDLYRRAKFEARRLGQSSATTGRAVNERAVWGNASSGRPVRHETRVKQASEESTVDLERRIQKVESRMKELEASFGNRDAYEVYREYEQLAQEVNVLYEAWARTGEGRS